jgi:phage shock protein C
MAALQRALGAWYGHKTGEEGSLDLGRLRGIAHHFGWSSTAVRVVVVFLAIFIRGVSVIPAVLIYLLLGFILPESEEF